MVSQKKKKVGVTRYPMVSIEDVLQVIAKRQKVLQGIKIILLDIAGYRKTFDGVDISKENSQGVTPYYNFQSKC